MTASERIRVPGTQVTWIDANNHVRFGTVVQAINEETLDPKIVIEDEQGNKASPSANRVGIWSDR